MLKLIKAVLAVSIAVIFFGVIYITGKDKNGMPNVFSLGMKLSSQIAASKAAKAGNNPVNISFTPSQAQNAFPQMSSQGQTMTPSQTMTPEQLDAANAAMSQYAMQIAELSKNQNMSAEEMRAATDTALAKYEAQMSQISKNTNVSDEATQAAAEQLRKENFPFDAAQTVPAQQPVTQAAAQTPAILSAPTAVASAPVAPLQAALPKRPLQSMTPQELSEALMVSVSSNNIAQAKQILSLGTDPNTVENATSATPLFTAIANNNPQMVQMLLDHGADVNQVNEKGSYPIHEAASGNAFVGDSKYRANEMIQTLIEHGADVNQKNAKGQTALMLACKAGRAETLVFLLNKNATTSIQDEKNKTVADYASEVPAKNCSDYLRKFTKEVL